MPTEPESRNPSLPLPDARLRRVLRSWEVDDTAPPGFGAAVWRRLESARRPATPGLGEFLAGWLAGCLRRPRFALTYMALLFLLGAGAGAFRGQIRSASTADGLQGQYVQSIDPFFAGVIR